MDYVSKIMEYEKKFSFSPLIVYINSSLTPITIVSLALLVVQHPQEPTFVQLVLKTDLTLTKEDPNQLMEMEF
jgi:hypothetical protein